MIVIPMAGRSQRFLDAGYEAPKYRLPLNGRSVFAHAVESFRSVFDDELFLFVTGPEAGAAAFVEAEARALGVAWFEVARLSGPTAGQAETVAQGLGGVGADPDQALTIFNIDTFRPGWRPPPGFEQYDGWLEVFEGEGANWSYVRPAPGPEPVALEAAEKRPISNLCCTGLYHFSRAGDFLQALEAEKLAPQARELYVAPLYNHLIWAGARIGYVKIARDEVVFCGVPAEYEALSGPV